MTKLDRVASDAAQYGNTLREIEDLAERWLLNGFTTVCEMRRQPPDTLALAREAIANGWMSVECDEIEEQLCSVEHLAAEFAAIIASECQCKKCLAAEVANA